MIEFIKDISGFPLHQPDDFLIGLDATLPWDTQNLLVTHTKRSVSCHAGAHKHLDEHEVALS